MAKTQLRKMLCDLQSQECIDLMRLIETQSKSTLAAWAISYAKENYLTIYEEECPGDLRLREGISACEDYLRGGRRLAEVKPVLKEAAEIARNLADQPVAQAAARAVATACAAIQTPTNALGFLFYGAAATAYHTAGLTQNAECYDRMALNEFRKAFQSLQQVSLPDEPNPAKMKWNC